MVPDRENWECVRLGDLVKITHGWPFKSELFSEERKGRPIVVGIGNFKYTGGFRFESTTVKEYTGEFPKEYELTPGDILLVMTCQTSGGEILGIPGRIPNDGNVYLHNQRMGKVVVTAPDKISPDFVYYLALTSDFNRELCVSASGTKILHTAPSRIEAFKFNLPPLPEQKAIARILGTLDDKIELNRRMNTTLEALAQALFQSWFVDFDPVHAKASGRQPSGMNAATAALFPTEFQDSALGQIPNGWRVGKISDLTQFNRASVNPGNFPEETFDHYSLPAFDEGRQPKVETGAEIKSNKLTVTPDEVLLSKLNPHIPRIWLPKLSATRRSLCSTEFLVARPSSLSSQEYLFALFTSSRFSTAYSTLVTGTTGSHQRIKADAVQNLDTMIPPEKLVAAFTELARPLFARINQNIIESLTLNTLRNTLLPRLLSGAQMTPHQDS